jgi:hypothetical protein
MKKPTSNLFKAKLKHVQSLKEKDKRQKLETQTLLKAGTQNLFKSQEKAKGMWG